MKRKTYESPAVRRAPRPRDSSVGRIHTHHLIILSSEPGCIYNVSHTHSTLETIRVLWGSRVPLCSIFGRKQPSSKFLKTTSGSFSQSLFIKSSSFYFSIKEEAGSISCRSVFMGHKQWCSGRKKRRLYDKICEPTCPTDNDAQYE